MAVRFTLVFSLICCSLLAQEGFSPIPNAYCQPGVINQSKGRGLLLSFGRVPHGFAPVSFNDVDFKGKVPVFYGERWTALLGVQYQQIHFGHFYPDDESVTTLESSPLRPQLLKKSRYSAYITHLINERMYAAVKIEASFNGDYHTIFSFDHDYAIYRIAGVVGLKKRADLEYGFGFLTQKSFRKFSIYPFLVYNQTFSPRWGIESTLPVSLKGRYNFTPNRMLLFGLNYSGGEYNLKDALMDTPFLRLRSLQFSTSYEQQIYSWTWFFVSAGYGLDLWSKLAPGRSSFFTFENTTGPFINFGIFLYPPKK